MEIVVVEATTHASVLVTGESRGTPAACVATTEAIDAAALSLVRGQTLSDRFSQRQSVGISVSKCSGIEDVGVNTRGTARIGCVVRLAAAGGEQHQAQSQ